MSADIVLDLRDKSMPAAEPLISLAHLCFQSQGASLSSPQPLSGTLNPLERPTSLASLTCLLEPC